MVRLPIKNIWSSCNENLFTRRTRSSRGNGKKFYRKNPNRYFPAHRKLTDIISVKSVVPVNKPHNFVEISIGKRRN